ncbi:unnamed protein product, partial [Prunus brigantina]
SRPCFGLQFSHPATKADGAGTKMTGPLSSSNPSQAPPPAAVFSPENRRETASFSLEFLRFCSPSSGE